MARIRYDLAIGLVRRMGRGDLPLPVEHWDVAAGSITYEFVKKGELKRRLSRLFDPLQPSFEEELARSFAGASVYVNGDWR